MTIAYAMTAIVLIIGLTLMFVDVYVRLKDSEHRNISIVLIGTTILYVAMDCLWIVEYTSENFDRNLFVVLNFLFYLLYITLPYIWFLFAKHFAGSGLKDRKVNFLFAVPWLFNLILVIITMVGPELLWSIGGPDNRYTRGPLFGLFTKVCLLYYFISVIGIAVLWFTGKGSDRRTLRRTLGFALIPALGVFIYTYWISVDAIYPFQPCCFFLGVMFAYIAIVAHVHEEALETEMKAKQQELEHRLQLQARLTRQKQASDQQARMITALTADYWSVYYLELDRNWGVCYQSHSDISDGFKVGEEFPYLESVTAYANQYITEQYREVFLRFIQPESIREGLAGERVISYTYMVERNGRESYEVVRFASVTRPDGTVDDHINHVGACFADVDAETRRTLAQSQALSDALANAEQANLAKSAFLSNMSHEIRTPMNAIIGLNNLAVNDPETPEKTKEYLRKIGTSAHHLLNIINDILDMSRIESGKMTINNEEFSFSGALEHVNTIISGQCRDKGINYECHLIGRIDDRYIADEVKLRQVLINILGNAVKFTPAGGSVIFTVEEAARLDNKTTLRFTVEDTGIGMSKEYLPHIFDAFTQEDSSTTSRYGSTGLGMPITKNIVDLMNGHIEVESEKGKGTKFTVTITLTDALKHDGENAGQDDLTAAAANPVVLIVDDDQMSRDHAVAALADEGIKCETASSGEEAAEMIKLRQARMEPYDLAVIDWVMPDVDGVETIRRIRELPGSEKTVLILASYSWEDAEDDAKKAGANGFVRKPLFAADVLDEFRKVLISRKESGDAPEIDLTGRRVLLAEDMPVNAEIMMMVLGMQGMEAELAENGKIAVEKFESHTAGYYDVILMDMRMPEMDGLEATRTIRAMDREDAKKIPIIALTANAFDEDVQRSMQAGLNAHLSKPVEPENLFTTISELLRNGTN